MTITPDPSRTISKPCPKCQAPMTLVPDVHCPQHWVDQIARWCCCELCAKKNEAKWQGVSRMLRACARYFDWAAKYAEWKALHDDGISCGEAPQDPGAYASTLINDGVAYYHRYLKMCGCRVFPKVDLVTMLTQNPGEPNRVIEGFRSQCMRMKSGDGL